MNNVRQLKMILFNLVTNPPNTGGFSFLSPLHLSGCDRDAAVVVVLIRWMPVLLVGTEGGSVNTTTKESRNWPCLL